MNNTIILNSTGFACPAKDQLQQQLKTALPDYNVLAGGYIEFYNVSFTKDKTEYHLNYNFKTPEQAQECASYLQFIYCLNYRAIKDLTCLPLAAIAEFKQQAKQSLKKLTHYRLKQQLLSAFNYKGGWYEYYCLCFNIANYKHFSLLYFRTQQQAIQAKQLLAQLGQPTAFYISKQQAPLYAYDKEYYKGTKKQFIHLIKLVQQSAQQLQRFKIFLTSSIEAGATEKISYSEVTYYTLKTDNNLISTSLHVFIEREQAERLAQLLTATENYGYNYSVVVATAYLTGDMEKAFNQCQQSSLRLLTNLQHVNSKVASHD